MNTNKPIFSISSILIILFSILFIPILNNTIKPLEILNVIIVVLFLFFQGYFIIDFCFSTYKISEVFKTGLSIILGSFISFFLLPYLSFFDNPIIIIAIIDLIILTIIAARIRITFKFNDWISLLILSFTFVHIFFQENFIEFTQRLPIQRNDGFMDNYFFAAVVSSLKDGNINNCIYEHNIGVYYHILSFVPAAVLSSIAQIPAHLSLWPIIVPFEIFLAFYSIFEIASFFIPELEKNIFKSGILFFIFYFLIPLNFKNLLTLKLTAVLWNTDPFCMPFLPTWNLFYILSSLILLIIFKTTKYGLKEIIMLSTLLFLSILAKVPGFYVVINFAGIYAMIVWYKEKDIKLLAGIVIGGLTSLLLVLYFFSKSSGKFVYKPGFLVSYLLEQIHLPTGNPLTLWFIGSVLFLILMLIWFNIRIIGINSLPNIKQGFNKIYLILSFIVALLSCFVIANSFRIQNFTNEGVVFNDSSFDLFQFFRAYFILIGIFGSIGIFIFLFRKTQSKIVVYTKIVIYCWLGFCFLCFIYYQIVTQRPTAIINNSWSNEVIKEIERTPHQKLIIQSNILYTGQFLSAFEVGNWYLCNRNTEGGYTGSTSHLIEFDQLDSLLSKYSISYSDSLLINLYKSNVDVFIASPININQTDSLVKIGVLSKIKNTRWLFKINSDIKKK